MGKKEIIFILSFILIIELIGMILVFIPNQWCLVKSKFNSDRYIEEMAQIIDYDVYRSGGTLNGITINVLYSYNGETYITDFDAKEGENINSQIGIIIDKDNPQRVSRNDFVLFYKSNFWNICIFSAPIIIIILIANIVKK